MTKKTLAVPAAVALMLTACGGATPTENGTAATPADPQAAAPPATDTPPAAQHIALGQRGASGAVAYTIRSVERQDTIKGSRKAETGVAYVVVQYLLENTGTSPLTHSDRPEITLVDGAGRTYSPDGGASLAVTENGIADVTNDVNPGTSAKVGAVWKVDKASFDPAVWTMVVASEPQMRFKLQ